MLSLLLLLLDVVRPEPVLESLCHVNDPQNANA
jgi:hypothetical protein